jgi:outer membrane biosynthesis protein TonB
VGLSDDQKAMLRLLAQREEGYDDMAALMGISVEEVRERVKEALAEVDEPEASAEPVVEDPAPAPEPTPPAAPAAPEPKVEAKPDPPAPVEPPATEKPAASSPVSKRSTQIPSLKLPKDRGALIGLGAGALVIVALVIVLIVSGDGGSDSGSEPTSAAQGSVAEGISATAKDKSLTQAVLNAEDGSDATGQAIFGRFKKKVVLQVTGEGLEPSADGESYAVWLSHGAKAMVPVGTAKVDSSGQLAARFEVPPAVLVLVARAAFDRVDVTRTEDSRLSAAIAQARKSENESTYTGTPVMSGEITGPLVGAGK